MGEGYVAVVLAPIFGESRAIWIEFARHIASLGDTAPVFNFPCFETSTGSFSITYVNSDAIALGNNLQQEGG